MFIWLFGFFSLTKLNHVGSLALPSPPVKAFNKTPLIQGYYKRAHGGSLSNSQRKLDTSSLHLPQTASSFLQNNVCLRVGKSPRANNTALHRNEKNGFKMALIPKEHQGDDSLCQTVGMKKAV